MIILLDSMGVVEERMRREVESFCRKKKKTLQMLHQWAMKLQDLKLDVKKPRVARGLAKHMEVT